MNLKLLNSFEKEFGVLLSSISKEKFLEIFYKKKLSEKYFTTKNNVYDILEYLKYNPNLKNFVQDINLKLKLRLCEQSIDDLFSRYLEDNVRESLIDSVKFNLEKPDAILCVSTALCSMIALEDQDISIYYNNVSNSIHSLILIVSALDLERSTYSTYCDILDLLIQTQFYWNSRYEDKIEINNLDEILTKLHDFEYNVLENGGNLSIDIAPENLELLDITKLKVRNKEVK